MKFEKLNKNYTKNIIISLIVIIIIGSVLVLNITKAKYRTTTSINIVNGTIKYSGSNADFNLIALYKQKVDDQGQPLVDEYDKINDISNLGTDAFYDLDEIQTKCYINDNELINEDKINVTLDESLNSLTFMNVKKQGTKCNVYFKATAKPKPQTSEEVLAGLGRKFIEGSSSFTTIDTAEHLSSGQSQMYKDIDELGNTYYFRGRVKDNWVKFGKTGTTYGTGDDIWWRIIRINGNGSIRLIYAGTGNNINTFTDTNGYTGKNSHADFYDWYTEYKTEAYLGYEWKSGKTHGYGEEATSGTAKRRLYNWFSQNLIDEFSIRDGFIDIEAGFCNDRSGAYYDYSIWDENTTGNGRYYGANLRLYKNTATPTFKCSTNYQTDNIPNKTADNFTHKNASTGTKSLDYPVGFITADEVVFAGGFYNVSNSSYYLYNGEEFWTMSPWGYYDKTSFMCNIDSEGKLGYDLTKASNGYRPIINLSSSVHFIGNGTINNPYVLQTS